MSGVSCLFGGSVKLQCPSVHMPPPLGVLPGDRDSDGACVECGVAEAKTRATSKEPPPSISRKITSSLTIGESLQNHQNITSSEDTQQNK